MSLFSRKKKAAESPPAIESKYHPRWLMRRDLAAVLAIEAEVFPEFPWGRMEFVDYLGQRNALGMVAEDRAGVLLGFVIFELQPARLEIANLAVRTDHQRQGVGRALVGKLIGKLSPERRSRILATVREANTGAQLFFRASGFRTQNVLRHYYADTDEDAYLFVYDVRRRRIGAQRVWNGQQEKTGAWPAQATGDRPRASGEK